MKRLVLDSASGKREMLDRLVQRLSSLSSKPEVVIDHNVALSSADLFVTDDEAHAMRAAENGATAWTVRQGTGELETWGDLPLAVAFATGTLDDVARVIADRPELRGEA